MFQKKIVILASLIIYQPTYMAIINTFLDLFSIVHTIPHVLRDSDNFITNWNKKKKTQMINDKRCATFFSISVFEWVFVSGFVSLFSAFRKEYQICL